MATVSGSLISMFSGGAVSPNHVNIASTIFTSASAFSWLSTFGFQVTLHSGLENIAYSSVTNLPVSGTIDDVTVIGGSTAFTVTGLSRPVTAMINPADPVPHHLKFWESVLLGSTTISNTESSGVFRVSGDFIEAGPGQTRNGAVDTFKFDFASSAVGLEVIGDALAVAAGGTLNGGADSMSLRNSAVNAFQIYGDSASNAGTLNGGNDTIAISCPFDISTVITGDCERNDGLLNGGDDRITVTSATEVFNLGFSTISGDAFSNAGTGELNGGDDTMILRFTGAAPGFYYAYFLGDADTVSGVNLLVRGGNDTMTIINANAAIIAGDVNRLDGGHVIGGNDFITGGTGADRLYGECAFNPSGFTLVGGNDNINGGEGNDTILGQSGNDVLTGGLGNDTLAGDSGTDTARFDFMAAGVHVDLDGILGTDTGLGNLNAIGQGSDQLFDIENVRGSSQADRIKGNFAANNFLGNAGDDILLGRDGNDILNGGIGNDSLMGGFDRDTLTGGTGVDTFIFRDVLETTISAATADRITDWATGDKIDLRTIDANGTGAGNTAFVFQTIALTGAGQLRAFQSGGNTIVEGSIDIDAAAEFVIVLNGLHAVSGASFML